MTKALCWLVGALLALAALASWDARVSDRKAGVALAALRAKETEVRRWQAKYAIASIDAQKRDTVFRTAKSRVDTLRQTLNVTDTLEVIRYVAAADSALQACTELANSCQVFRVTADSTLTAERKVNDALRQYAESVKPSMVQKYWWATAITGVVIGAWIRGNE